MCRSKDTKTKNTYCDLLNDEGLNFDDHSPLPTKRYWKVVGTFISAARAYSRGERAACENKLKKIKKLDADIKDWSIKHAQVSGRNRNRILNIKISKSISESKRDKIRKPSKKLEEEVFERDNYHCRYCGMKLISKRTLKTFAKELSKFEGGQYKHLFYYKNTNETKHSIVHLCLPVADHVHPWRLGGKTSKSNLVTACGPCNYGKHNFTCKEIGITDPKLRDPITDGWNGLTNLFK